MNKKNNLFFNIISSSFKKISGFIFQKDIIDHEEKFNMDLNMFLDFIKLV